MGKGQKTYPKWLEWALKLLIIGGAIVIIHNRLSPGSYEGIFSSRWYHAPIIVPLFVLLWALNLLLDAHIWQKVHGFITSINLKKALETNLVCYALSFITPVNSGELAGRYLMLESKAYRRKAVFLTFWSHFPRLIVKLLLGTLALAYLVRGEWSELSLLIAVSITLIMILSYFLFIRVQAWLAKRGWGSYKLEQYLIRDRPRFTEKLQLLITAAAKFFTYNIQFLLLLILWGNLEIDLRLLTSVIAMYVLGAMIPTIPLADFLVKAGIAFAIFDTSLVEESILLNAALVTWLFNLALPALAGTIIIMRTDLRTSLKKQSLPDSLYDS